MLKVCALVIVAAVSAFLLKDFGWKGVPVFCLIAFVGILSFAGTTLFTLGEVFDFLGESGEITEGCADILKVIGIGYVAGISGEICRELGAGSLASAVSIIARLEVLLLVLPYLIEAVRLGMELIG